MTIRIEREALLTVINTSQRDTTKTAPTSSFSSNSCYPCIEDEFVIVDSLPTKDTIPNSTKDDETASLCTLSTSSTSYIDSSSDVSTVERSVSFAPQLVTDVWTRERTLPEEVSNLFYSATETQTFRQEYRLERKLLSELSIDPETFPVDDENLSNLVAASTTPVNGRHRISRVCVVYNDKLETFCNPADLKTNYNSQLPLTASFTSQQQQDSNKSDSSIPSDFFDNDSFWSGSLTWY